MRWTYPLPYPLCALAVKLKGIGGLSRKGISRHTPPVRSTLSRRHAGMRWTYPLSYPLCALAVKLK